MHPFPIKSFALSLTLTLVASGPLESVVVSTNPRQPPGFGAIQPRLGAQTLALPAISTWLPRGSAVKVQLIHAALFNMGVVMGVPGTRSGSAGSPPGQENNSKGEQTAFRLTALPMATRLVINYQLFKMSETLEINGISYMLRQEDRELIQKKKDFSVYELVEQRGAARPYPLSNTFAKETVRSLFTVIRGLVEMDKEVNQNPNHRYWCSIKVKENTLSFEFWDHRVYFINMKSGSVVSSENNQTLDDTEAEAFIEMAMWPFLFDSTTGVAARKAAPDHHDASLLETLRAIYKVSTRSLGNSLVEVNALMDSNEAQSPSARMISWSNNPQIVRALAQYYSLGQGQVSDTLHWLATWLNAAELNGWMNRRTPLLREIFNGNSSEPPSEGEGLLSGLDPNLIFERGIQTLHKQPPMTDETVHLLASEMSMRVSWGELTLRDWLLIRFLLEQHHAQREKLPLVVWDDAIQHQCALEEAGHFELLRRLHPYTLESLKQGLTKPLSFKSHEGDYYALYAEKLLGRIPEEGRDIVMIDPHQDFQSVRLDRPAAEQTLLNLGSGGHGVSDAMWVSAAIRDRLARRVLIIDFFMLRYSVAQRDEYGDLVISPFITYENSHDIPWPASDYLLTVDLDQFSLFGEWHFPKAQLFIAVNRLIGLLREVLKHPPLRLTTADSWLYLDPLATHDYLRKARDLLRAAVEKWDTAWQKELRRRPPDIEAAA